MNANNNKTQLLFTKLANKFPSIKFFYISFFEEIDDCVLLFWKWISLHNQMLNRNMYTELHLSNYLKEREYNKLVSMIEKYNPKISKICMETGQYKELSKQKVWENKIIRKCNDSLEYIAIDDTTGTEKSFRSIIDVLELNLNNDQSKLQIVELHDWNRYYKERLIRIKNVLEWEMIIKYGLIMIVFVHIITREQTSLATFKPQFESVCDRAIVLVKKQIGLNLTFRFVNIDENCCDYIDKYLIDFEKNRLLKEYKVPKCSKIAQKYVEPLTKPIFKLQMSKQKIVHYCEVVTVFD